MKPWIFWPRRPYVVEMHLKENETKKYGDRDIDSIFVGNIENKIQEKYRETKDEWDKVLDVYHCTQGQKHKFTQEEYLDMMSRSKYGLCLRGFGKKCHREVECMALGTVPIITNDVCIDSYINPPKEGVHYIRVHDREDMKKVIGVSDINEMFTNVPKEVSLDPKFNLPNHKTEMEVGKILSEIANKNINSNQVPFFLGAGAYKHHIPATVDHIIQRSEFLTSYTPYQPEISQGTLQYLFEFQTQVSLITGMDVSNASMYDGSTSTAEAVSMAKRITKRNKVVLSPTLHPQYAEVINTLISSNEDEIDYEFSENFEVEKLISKIDDSVSCIVVQNPDFFGSCHSLEQLAEYAHSKGALLIVVVNEIISLGMMKSPGEMGADIVACEGQSLGNPLNFGGPYIGLMSTKDKYVRQLPGRIVGETIDMNGEKGFVLTLATREQHIRREKATSNICTNSGLCSLAFTIHLSLLGEMGFKKLSKLNHEAAIKLYNNLKNLKLDHYQNE